MNPAAESPVERQQLAHSSVRAYTGEAIPPELLERLVRAGQAAASSSFIQACSIVQVTEPEARRRIAAAAGGQAWIEKAAEFLVYCADMRRIEQACIEQGAGELEGWSEHGLQAIIDVALVAQNLLLAAESAGLGGVYIGGIRNAPDVIVDQLQLPHRVLPLFGMCLGWPADKPEVKPRMPLSLVLHRDRYQEPNPDSLAAYDAEMAAYFQRRSSNARAGDWSTTTAKAVQGKKREHMLAFLRERGFFRC